jgi:SHS2 domain-containing protein
MSGRFRFLDDVALADAAFDAEADTPAELFEAAARAVIETLADPATVGTTWRREIRREDADPAALLFDWLSDIVYWKDAAGVVFHTAEASISEDAVAGWRLAGLLTGEPVDSARQDLRNDVKAITKHLYRVERFADGRWHARVVLDL